VKTFDICRIGFRVIINFRNTLRILANQAMDTDNFYQTRSTVMNLCKVVGM